MVGVPVQRKISLISFSVCLLGLLTSCVKQTATSEFNPTPFRDSPSAITLCFDLRNDARPIAGLILKLNQTPNVESRTVVLPFDSTAVSMNREIYSAWGSYEATTLINFHTSPSTSGTYALGIVPVVSSTPSDQWSEDLGELNQSSIYYIRQSNLIRHFIFKYPDADPDRRLWLQNLTGVTNTNVESVGIVLPPNVEGRAIKRTNRTSVPDPLHEAGIANFYPASKTGANGAEAIHIKYELPPTKNQQLIIEQAIKLVVALLPPAIQFIVIRLRKPGQKKRVKRLIWIVAGIQIFLLAGLLYMAISAWHESTGKALADLTTAIVTGLFTAYNLWDEKKDLSNSHTPAVSN